jgi:hypothetical protein
LLSLPRPDRRLSLPRLAPGGSNDNRHFSISDFCDFFCRAASAAGVCSSEVGRPAIVRNETQACKILIVSDIARYGTTAADAT